jgi:dTDP-glucose 4,6-dehydratase
LGFIGGNFVRQVVKEHPEIEVTNVDKLGVGSNPESLRDLQQSSNYVFVKGDISNPRFIYKYVKEADAVVNFAAETHVDRSIADPSPFVKSNVTGVFTLLEAVRKTNSSAVYVQVSTDEVYGDTVEGSYTEQDRLAPSNPYSATKAAADMLCLAYHRTYGLSVKITRCTNNFGPYQFPEKMIPKAVIRAHRNLQVPVYGKGENVRDWIYVLDHCEAVFRVLEKGKPGEIYNVSSGNEVPNIELVRQVLKMLSKKESLVAFVEDRPGHDLRYSLDSTKIRAELGWKPRRTFQSALRETVDWYVKNEQWWKPLATDEVLSPTPWKTKQ